MIYLPNKDRTIFDLPLRIADILLEYKNTGKVDISTNSEGIDLACSDFYQALDYLCEKHEISKACITIHTANSVENHTEYNIVHHPNHWAVNAKKRQYTSSKSLPLFHVGSFVGKPNWHRLVMGAWLHNNFSDKCLQTLHYDHSAERHRIDSELTDISRESNISELQSVVSFMPACPLTLSEGFINYTIGADKHYNILSEYSKIFLDLVTETYISGASFFPTEKTFRPIIANTPFITIGPVCYLARLRQVGFKTFDKWWDESYDSTDSYARLCEIRKILVTIFSWSNEKMIATLEEMQPVLEHNKKLLLTLTGREFIHVK